jgi:hypothetical protein
MTEIDAGLTFITESLPAFSVGVDQVLPLEVSGGTPPYHFKITRGTLPFGLAMSQDGTISGAIAKRVPDSTVFVEVTDSNGCRLTHGYDVELARR